MAGMFTIAEGYARAVRNIHRDFYPPYIAKGRDWVSLPGVLLRFAQWDKLASLDPPTPDSRGWSPKDGYKFSMVIWHLTRFLIQASKVTLPSATAKDLRTRKLLEEGQATSLEAARAAFEELRQLMEDGPENTITEPGAGVGIYSGGYGSLAKIAFLEATAKLSLLEGNVVRAFCRTCVTAARIWPAVTQGSQIKMCLWHVYVNQWWCNSCSRSVGLMFLILFAASLS